MLQRKTSDAGLVYYLSPLLQNAGVGHIFSTRIGGVSTGPFGSLNLGNPNGQAVQDDLKHIDENYRRLMGAAGLTGRERCWLHQVHSGDVVCVRKQREFTNSAKADALVSDDPKRVLSIRIADCAPVLIASDDGQVVAVVHAGWRGVIAGIVPNALREMRRLHDGRFLAAVGPCISACNFEVGPEVLDEFHSAFGDDAPIQRRSDGKGEVDLRRAIELQLNRLGITSDRIDLSDVCTHRDAAEFYSHRRDQGLTGRMSALIAASIRP